MEAAVLELKHIKKTYPNGAGIYDISLTIDQSGVYGLLGPNGAGKSTLMNVVTGYLGATEGSVLVNGKDSFREALAVKKQIGYLPEVPPLYEDMTVAENLRFAAELKRLSKEEVKAQTEEKASLLGLEKTANRLVRNLSKGFRQRVGLAMALLGDPALLILDEPTAGLDPAQIAEFRELVRRLGEERTVILSSHILGEIREVCRHVYIMSDGRLVLSEDIAAMETAGESLEEVFLTLTTGGEAAREGEDEREPEGSEEESDESCETTAAESEEEAAETDLMKETEADNESDF